MQIEWRKYYGILNDDTDEELDEAIEELKGYISKYKAAYEDIKKYGELSDMITEVNERLRDISDSIFYYTCEDPNEEMVTSLKEEQEIYTQIYNELNK